MIIDSIEYWKRRTRLDKICEMALIETIAYFQHSVRAVFDSEKAQRNSLLIRAQQKKIVKRNFVCWRLNEWLYEVDGALQQFDLRKRKLVGFA